MKIAFYSNFMNHHQEQLSKELYKLTDGNYYFVACEEIERERLDMGYEDMNKKYDFIIRPYEGLKQAVFAEELAKNSDVVIFGSGDEKYFELRMETDKLTFRYSERLLKKGLYRRFIPITRKKIFDRYIKYKNKPMYTLCSSAYTSYDLTLCGFPKDKLYKWGYFPDVKKQNIDELIDKKKNNSIIWVGRLIDWKHPEIPVKIAEKLRDDNVDFEMNIIGNGIIENKIKKLIKAKRLENNVKMLGSMSPDMVRNYMEISEIFLFTSDFNEGWGAVLNEAMNSGCACVVSHAIGSAPYLIKDDVNGYLYKNSNIEDLYKKVLDLIENQELRRNFGTKAYETVCTKWDAENAAERFIRLSEELTNKRESILYKDGPCSKAEILKNNWY